jgi:hypothetical protein
MLLTSQGGYLGSKAITKEDSKEEKTDTVAETPKANEDKPVEEKKEG